VGRQTVGGSNRDRRRTNIASKVKSKRCGKKWEGIIQQRRKDPEKVPLSTGCCCYSPWEEPVGLKGRPPGGRDPLLRKDQ